MRTHRAVASASASIALLAAFLLGGTLAPAALSASWLPPEVSTGPANEVTQDGVTLTGTIDTHGSETAYEFDLGADTSYGTRIFGDIRFKEGPEALAVSLLNLAAGSTYHYRLVAWNAYGTVDGADETFATPAFPTALLIAPAALPLLPAPLIGALPASAATSRSATNTARERKAKAMRRTGGRRKRRPTRRTAPVRAPHVHAAKRQVR